MARRARDPRHRRGRGRGRSTEARRSRSHGGGGGDEAGAGADGRERAARTLLKLNQNDGFDCQGCAWPDPDPGPAHRRVLRERRQGRRRGGHPRPGRPDFFADALRSPTSPSAPTTGSASRAGITEPMVLRAGGTHYEPISWDDAFALIAERLRGLDSPDQAVFYTSGQHLQRGRVRLPALRPRLRHEQPARLLEHVPRVHVGRRWPRRSASARAASPRGLPRGRADRHHRPEPGHQPPADADRAGAGEAQRRQDHRRQPAPGGRADPLQEPAERPRGVGGVGTALADLYLQVRINGDLALLQAIGSLLLEWGCVDQRLRRPAHHRLRAVRRARSATSTGTPWSAPPG